jgi:hypothetical protein
MSLGVHASVSDDRFLIFLNELAAATAESSEAIRAGVPVNAVLVLHIATLEALEDRRDGAIEKDTMGDALQPCQSGRGNISDIGRTMPFMPLGSRSPRSRAWILP